MIPDSPFFPTYRRLPIDVVRGEGVRLIARDGRSYLDMFAGLAVNALGYGHPALLEAIDRQARLSVHLSNYLKQDIQNDLAHRLLAASGFDRVFLCNSGTEGMEAALKLARRWGGGKGRVGLIGFSGSFHGRTLGALSVTGRERYREGFGPLLPDARILPFNDVQVLEEGTDERTAAVAIEFIQGEGGIRPVSPEFADALAELRERRGFLVIADETQSGIGRTGKFSAYEHFGFRPDIVVVAKALGGGLPLGAMMARETMASCLPPGSHGSTFGGNPVACAAGCAVLREIVDNGVMAHAASMGVCLREALISVAGEFPSVVKEVRGAGLMLGMELFGEAAPVASRMLDAGVLVNVTDTTVLRWLPPLVVKSHEIDEAIWVLRNSLRLQKPIKNE